MRRLAIVAAVSLLLAAGCGGSGADDEFERMTGHSGSCEKVGIVLLTEDAVYECHADASPYGRATYLAKTHGGEWIDVTALVELTEAP